jgi:hypothetical protein
MALLDAIKEKHELRDRIERIDRRMGKVLASSRGVEIGRHNLG